MKQLARRGASPRRGDPSRGHRVPTEPAARPVRVLSAERLTGPGSTKDVRHVVIDLAGSGLTYEPGRLPRPRHPASIRRWSRPPSSPSASEASDPVPCPDGVSRPAADAFATHLDIARPLDRTLDLLAMSARYPQPRRDAGASSPRASTAPSLPTPTCSICSTPFPRRGRSLADLAASLPPLRPRLYSIASSPRASQRAGASLRRSRAGHPARPDPPRHRQRLPGAIAQPRPATSGPTSRPAISACRPIPPCRSSWSGRAPASRRSAPSSPTAPQQAPAAAPGCSSASAPRRRLPLPHRTRSLAARRHPDPARHRVLPRPGRQDLRAGPHGGERRRPVALAAGRRAFLRLRRRHPHGEGRRCRACAASP